jgi:hypothetical protein
MSSDASSDNKSSFGACSFAKTSPTALAADTRAINLVVTFEEALKLNLAIDECVRTLGRYNRAKSRGKNAALMMVIHLDKKRIRILEGKAK